MEHDAPRTHGSRTAWPTWVAGASLAVLLGWVLLVAGRPLATNDLWWHLALGRAYVAQGPWLAADPLLHTARATPPQPVAWLFDLALHGTLRATGHHGLRGLHLLLAAAIAALALSLFRRERAPPAATALATGAFLVLAWPRVFQLRPDLVSILATLALYRLLLEPREPPSWRRVTGAAALLLLWANAHSLFMLGPCLLLAGLLGCLLRGVLAHTAAEELARARRLAAALALGLVAALANPLGLRQHLAFWVSAGEGAIFAVGDDWTPFHPLAWDRYGFTVGLLEWLVADAVLILFVGALVAGLVRFLRNRGPATLDRIDPVRFALGLAALVAAGSSVRFLWLAFFPLLAVLHAGRATLAAHPAAARACAWSCAVGCATLAIALPFSSGFATVRASLPEGVAAYLATPYDADKYSDEGVRFLEESGVEGRLFNSYAMGGYLGYRLAPRLRTFLDGRMNVADDVFRDYASVNQRRGSLPGETFLDVLDRRRIDVFFGVGGPPTTAGHLTGAPGWRLVARGRRYAIYLRETPRNAENLRRIAAWYARREAERDSGS